MVKNKTNFVIPNKEDLHRYASNLLSIGDFSTDRPSGYQINRVESAIRWTKQNANKAKKK